MSENTLPFAELTSNRGPSILAVGWTECAIAILFVNARMYTRISLIHNVGIDDWMMLLALVSPAGVLIRR